MTATDALFVRIRNPDGKYLGGDAMNMGFFDDIKKAVIFDYRRDQIAQQLEFVRLTQGLVVEVVPVDPKEMHETCDRCGRLVMPFHVFFDGDRYLCASCRNAAHTG